MSASWWLQGGSESLVVGYVVFGVWDPILCWLSLRKEKTGLQAEWKMLPQPHTPAHGPGVMVRGWG